MARVRRVESRKELERSIDEFITRGYELESKGEGCAHLRDRDWGRAETHLFIAGLTGWWTFGLANALYAIYRRVNAEKVVIQVENSQDKEVTGDCLEQQRFVTAKTGVGTLRGQGSGESEYPEETSIPETGGHNLTSVLTRVGLQIFSLSVAGFVLFTIFAASVRTIEYEVLGLTIGTLVAAIAFRYTAVYHQFKSVLLKKMLLGVTFLTFLAIGGLTIQTFLNEIRPAHVLSGLHRINFQLQLDTLLPEWWITLILSVAGGLILSGLVTSWDFSPYPKPSRMREIPASPPYFGLVCSIFGIWAVMFVGFSVQRIIIIAPFFEELLKFGVALLISSVLFGRSRFSRIGTAIVVGSLFGFIEHGTTYSSEPSVSFLFRTLFHMTTTVLSVSVYSAFERHGEPTFQSLAPVYSILIHFYYNTFVVMSSIILAVGFETSYRMPSLLYGSGVILLVSLLVILSFTRYRILQRIHLPFKYVLSHLV